jgi:hypothetical protein
MAHLDFSMKPSFECADDDSGDVAFVHAMGLIGGRDAVEEYLAYRMFPLLAGFSFTGTAEGEMPVLKVILPLPEFLVTKFKGESYDHFLARVELGVENVVGNYSHMEHDACIQALPNGGRLNWVFEKAGVAYGPHSKLGTEASMEAA